VKTLDHRGLDDGGVVCHFPLGGVVVELWVARSLFGIFGGKFWLSVYFYLFIFDPLVRGSPHHLVSVRPLWLYL
jgi:hypothetical protein